MAKPAERKPQTVTVMTEKTIHNTRADRHFISELGISSKSPGPTKNSTIHQKLIELHNKIPLPISKYKEKIKTVFSEERRSGIPTATVTAVKLFSSPDLSFFTAFITLFSSLPSECDSERGTFILALVY
ncbi:hypothetical protein MG293_013473 [Ovis ammon polii]|uniref:Uncharacterized protein n=1 Tax=Ovis ammon polii TaxID=230172 RepID=A0AAD4Y776_OVIAM|nr:hypothetical protein MG293_013473 [Ovis ammon polii]